MNMNKALIRIAYWLLSKVDKSKLSYPNVFTSLMWNIKYEADGDYRKDIDKRKGNQISIVLTKDQYKALWGAKVKPSTYYEVWSVHKNGGVTLHLRPEKVDDFETDGNYFTFNSFVL